jgi:uncharacterized protein (TIGR03000 family)
MLLQRLRTPLALAFVLLGPLGVFAQRHTSAPVPVGFPSTAVAGSTYRALIGPPVVNVSNIPMRGSIPANFPTNNLSQYPNGGYPPFFPTGQGVYRPMAGAGDSDPDVRLNTPEDENLLRAFRPQSASSLPVYQPSSSADVSTPTAPATALPGTVVVRVPAAAQVWFDDSATRSTGTERSFQTPTLTAGKTYRYDVKVRWLQDGKPVDVTRSVDVRPGERTVVDFLAPNP